jgi:ribonucleotide monophosphatase NagD (HAD superfamily)
VITAAIRKLTKAPMILTGKPSLDALRFVARKLGVPMKSLAVVGDDPLVEIVMARRAGAMAFGVTTGTTSAEEWAQQAPIKRPHRILSGVADVLSFETVPA